MLELRDLAQLQSMQVLAWTLVHFLWQGAVLGLAAFLVLRIVRPERASTRYAVAVTTLALMLVTSAATFLALSRQPIARETMTFDTVTRESSIDSQSARVNGLAMSPGARPPVVAADEATSPISPDPLAPALLLLILAGWSLGVSALSVRLIGGWVMTRHLARSAIEGVSPSIESAARRIAARLHVRRRVAIFESGAVLVPTLIGWIKPVVLLPASALAGLSAEQLEAILAHELAHVRRHDYLVNLLQSVIETLLFYHPAVWWVSARVRAEREHCCDDLAVDACGDRLVYVSALAELTTLANRRSLALAATDGSLLGRVRRILGGQRPTSEPAPAWALLALVALVVGSAGTFGAATPDVARPAASPAVVAPIGTITWRPPVGGPYRQPVVAQPAVSATAGTQQSPEVEMLRAEADRLRREADRLRREADRIRAEEARLRAPQGQWFAGWIDGFAFVTPPAPPVPPVPPEPPVPPVPPAPPLAEFAPMPPVPPSPPMAPRPPMPPYPSMAPLPPMPPAPPVPPMPPAPPEIQSRGNGNMSWSNNGETVQMRWTGAFRLSDDERDIASVEEGETVTIGDGVSRVELRGLSGGRIERTFRKDGVARAYEPEGRLFLAEMLTKIVRRSGLFAKERVARFLKQGGPDAVFAEIDRLDNSSYVRRVYYTELLQQAEGTDALVTKVLQRVRSELKSDYDKRTLLTAIAKRPQVTDAQRVLVANVAGTITSDYDQRQSLEAVLDAATTSASVAAAVLDTATSIGSNYDRSLVLSELARKRGISPATTPAFMNLVRGMDSSYEQRRVLTAVVERGGLTDQTADDFFTATGGITSSYDKSLVLRQVAALPSPSDKILQGLLRTASSVSSNHEKANVLVDVAGRHRLSDAARQLYLRAAEDIGSSHDSNRALAALARTR